MGEQLLRADGWRLFDVAEAGRGGLEDYLRRILSRCVDWFEASNGSLFLADEVRGDFELVAAEGKGAPKLTGARIKSGQGIAGLAIESGEPLLLQDPDKHPLLQTRVQSKRDVASSIVVPLITQESGVIGVINLARATGQSPFSPQDLERVRSVAGHLSLAVSNARLFRQVQTAMAEAKSAEDRLASVVRCLGVAVLVVDAKGVATTWNPLAETLLGANIEALAISPVSRSLSVAVDQALRGQMGRERAEDRENDRAWTLIATPLPEGGATVAIEEVTEQERAQREMARLARLAEVGQMTAAIAHEIRNPLTGIRSAAQMAKIAPEMVEELADIIEAEVVKLNELCEDFLDFAKPLKLRYSAVDLGQLASTIARGHTADFAQKGVALEVQIPAEVPTIAADDLRLEQVLRNLVLNALQACSRGGVVRLNVEENGFSVEDTGCGISEEGLSRLFTPFFTTKANGTGLGLSNLRKIVDAHNGKIKVTSEVGKGSKFTVTLPRGGKH